LGLVNPVTRIPWSEFAAAMLMGLLDLVLVVVLRLAYQRCRHASLLLLAVGSLAFVYVNAVSAMVSIFSITHVRIFSAPTRRITKYDFILFDNPPAVGHKRTWAAGSLIPKKNRK
ncbi:MAG: hypothetical protein ACRD4E_06960, partial [Bryobacteraceae bacterium]